ncbi:MAG: DUF1127 domain-containing protein [Alphaproteobacteria bacterium]|nr:DUF1127 domain-containing protein [Alphaproteobacteria bacterium]
MQNQASARRLRLSSRPSLLSPIQVLTRLSELLATWERRARERRMLAEMSPHMLKDLGIARSEASAESQKPFWRG